MEADRHPKRRAERSWPPSKTRRADRRGGDSYRPRAYSPTRPPREPRRADRLPPRRNKRQNHDAPTNSSKHSVNPLKSKIRDLTRSLEHNEDLPAGVRIEKERALAGYKQDLEEAEADKQKQALISRYHMVRFVERQKATRHLKKAEKRLSASFPNTPDHQIAQQDVHIAQVDLNYTLYHPLVQKYEGIYPRDEPASKSDSQTREHVNGGETEKALASRPAMWKVVEACMAANSLEALRNGKMTTTLTMGQKKPMAKAKAHARGGEGGVMLDFGSKPEMTKNGKDGQASEDESDGGFFEQ